MPAEHMHFRAEVSRLLDIVVHSLYSDKEVFLRELISNASDACDKLRYEAITRPELIEGAPDFKITVTIDKKARTVTVADNGIGMTRDELVENLGTIARSGTSAFLEQLKEKDKAGITQIGQFGVGFYAAFMVAQAVEVNSRKAGSSESWTWESDGRGEFTIEEGDKESCGTEVVVYLKQGEDEYLNAERLKAIISKYSDHIAIPIFLDGGEKPANRASALWMRSKNEITADQYKEFYHHVAHAFDEAALTMHWRAEGKIEYTSLLFVPGTRPFDLFDPKREHAVKLYVKRVFITDRAEGLVPPWLRFLRGVVDSEDLPLNISREMLQNNPMLAKIRQGVTKRVLSDLSKFASDNP
ncbi:MAG: molecular chaperone HtpG, partial [Bdellovibrionales bacterium]